MGRWFAICCAGVLLLTGCQPAPTDEAGGLAVGLAAPEDAATYWRRVPAPDDLPTDRPLRAGFLILNGVYNTELTAPYDLFHHTPFHTEPRPGMEVFTVSPDGEPVVTFEGLTVAAHFGFADAPEIDILVVPSAEGNMDRDLENEELIAWVREVGSRARYVISLCDGAFILAAAGLLDGHACTTFPGDQDSFGEVFPALDLRRGVSFVHDGGVLTSEGGAKSFDVAMHLIDHLYGEAVARGVGGGLIIAWPPGALRALIVD
jgi:transcriptional regulator GlxA family with amidase domain